jgi:hypothetical protein
MTYASKYLPAPPSTLISTAVNTLKSYLTQIPSYPAGYTPKFKGS